MATESPLCCQYCSFHKYRLLGTVHHVHEIKAQAGGYRYPPSVDSIISQELIHVSPQRWHCKCLYNSNYGWTHNGCLSASPQHPRKCKQRRFYEARIKLYSPICHTSHLACFTCLYTCLFSVDIYNCNPSVNRESGDRGGACGIRPSSPSPLWPVLWAKPEWCLWPAVENSVSTTEWFVLAQELGVEGVYSRL